jgi:hypothetical protein
LGDRSIVAGSQLEQTVQETLSQKMTGNKKRDYGRKKKNRGNELN